MLVKEYFDRLNSIIDNSENVDVIYFAQCCKKLMTRNELMSVFLELPMFEDFDELRSVLIEVLYVEV